MAAAITFFEPLMRIRASAFAGLGNPSTISVNHAVHDEFGTDNFLVELRGSDGWQAILTFTMGWLTKRKVSQPDSGQPLIFEETVYSSTVADYVSADIEK